MKYLYLIVGSLLLAGTAYAQCDEKGITTAPDAPTNSQRPTMTNPFDWRAEGLNH